MPSSVPAAHARGPVLGRRAWTLLVAATLVAAPAAVLRATCAGRACDAPAEAAAGVPFCSLPEGLRARIAAGFREGRSPDVLAVTAGVPVAGGAPGAPAWPSVERGPERVPLAFAGAGVDPSAPVPAGTGLDDVAPTIAAVAGVERPHPEVRSGEPVPGVASGAPARLVVEIVLEGVDGAGVAAGGWPAVTGLVRRGAGTLEAVVPSEPLDAAAVTTTIGTGGLPRDHGVTGALVRDDAGRLVRAWSRRAPVSIVAALGDDLDEVGRGRPLVGLVAGDPLARGLVGRAWYVDVDRDDVVYARSLAARVHAAERLLKAGYGDDAQPDLLAVSLAGEPRRVDAAVARLTAAAERAAPGGAAVVVTATGDAGASGPARDARALARAVERRVGAPVVEAVAAGGLFLDQDVLAAEGVTEDEVVDALLRDDVFADAFPAIAVSFARYC